MTFSLEDEAKETKDRGIYQMNQVEVNGSSELVLASLVQSVKPV